MVYKEQNLQLNRNKNSSCNKRNFTLEQEQGYKVWVSQLAKISTLFPDWLDYEKGHLFSCIEREEDLKVIHEMPC